MSDEQALARLSDLGLNGMVQAYQAQLQNPEAQALAFADRFLLLIENESCHRDTRKQLRLLKQARLKMQSAVLEDVKYAPRRGLDKSLIANLSTNQWIDRNQHLLLTGSTGVGKTWLACAFGHQAIRQSMSVLYFRVNRLLEETVIARADGSLPKLRSKIARCRLLILDDWGLSPLTEVGKQDLLEFVDDRTGSGSIVIASQLPIKSWYDYINEPTLADAILDRIVHRAHKIELSGASMRKKLGMEEGGV